MHIEKIIIITIILVLNGLLAEKYIKKNFKINLYVISLSTFALGIYSTYAVLDIYMHNYMQNILLVVMFILPLLIYMIESYNMLINRNIKYRLIKMAMSSSKYELAIKRINNYITRYGKFESLYYDLGMCYKMINDYASATDAFAKAVEFDKKDYKSYYELGRILDETDKKDTAIIMFSNSIKTKPDFYEALESLGICYTSKARYMDAINVYKEALKYHDSSYELYYNLAMLQMEIGSHEEALESFVKAGEYKPRLFSAYYNIGLINYMKGNNEEAIRYFKEARSSTIYGGKAYYNLAKIYASASDNIRALSCLEYAIEINSSFLKEAKTELVFEKIRGNIYEYEADMTLLEEGKKRRKDYLKHNHVDEAKRLKVLQKKIDEDITKNS